MIRFDLWIGILNLFILVINISGCSSVRPIRTGRLGLFDRMNLLESPRHVSRGLSNSSGNSEASLIAAKEIAYQNHLDFRWPLRSVRVTSPFGKRGSEFHEGVDLRAGSGTPVYAAQNGVVLYAAKRIRGYGKMVVISHRGGLATVYAHNSKLFVRRGQRVHQGQMIALSGKTGHAHGPHLHFEVRKDTSAVDPVRFMSRDLEKRAEVKQNSKSDA